MNNIAKLLQAASFAAQKHTGQTRKGDDAAPYINHPLEVANLLANLGKVEDYDVLIAAILHDTVEDTETTEEEIEEHFGETVASIVMEVTDDKSLAEIRTQTKTSRTRSAYLPRRKATKNVRQDQQYHGHNERSARRLVKRKTARIYRMGRESYGRTSRRERKFGKAF